MQHSVKQSADWFYRVSAVKPIRQLYHVDAYL